MRDIILRMKAEVKVGDEPPGYKNCLPYQLDNLAQS